MQLGVLDFCLGQDVSVEVPELDKKNPFKVFPPTVKKTGPRMPTKKVEKDFINKLTQDKNLKDNQETEDKKLMEEWEQHMNDFVPEDINTIMIEPRSEMTFYEDVGEDAIYVRGAYFIAESSNNKFIDFFVLDPNNKVIFSRRQKDEGIFRFNTTMKGTYSFVFSNMRDRNNQKELTIAIHTPGNDDEVFTDSDPKINTTFESRNMSKNIEEQSTVSQIKAILKDVYDNLRTIQTEAKFSGIRQQSYNDEVVNSDNYNFYMVVIESLIFIAICLGQVYYIKRILENKRVI